MKNRIAIILFTAIMSITAFSQGGSVAIQIVNPLPTLDLTQFISARDLCGAPEVFRVLLEPKGQQGYVKCYFSWKKVNQQTFEEVYSMTTDSFAIRDFYSNELCGSDVRVHHQESNSTLIQEALTLGIPVGSYKIRVELYSTNNAQIGQAEEIRDFTNPTSTLSLISPMQLMVYDENSVPASWNPVIGATSYRVRAVRVTNVPPSLESALAEGSPCIDNVDVGLAISVNNLGSLQGSNPWRPGDFVVVRVSAIVPSAGTTAELNSNIVLFQIRNANAPQGSAIAQLITNMLSFLPPNMVTPELRAFLIEYGNSMVSFQGNDGQNLNVNELLLLLNQIIQNPEILSNIYIQR